MLIGLYSDQSFPYSFEAIPDARGTALHNHVTVGVEDLSATVSVNSSSLLPISMAR